MRFFKTFLFSCLLITFALSAEQKVVLITGATGGIGMATVKAFQEKGWKVWAGYRNQVPSELKQLNKVKWVQLDVTDDRLTLAVLEAILKEDGRIDALINNAGYGLIGAGESVTMEEAKHLFDVNFFGALRLIQAVLPTMRQQNSGHIINISSGVGVHPMPGLGLYSATKFALEAMSEALSVEVARWNIGVSIVEPGFVKNEWGKHCVVGSRPTQEDTYRKLTKGITRMLSIPQGQPNWEVADLLVSIAENPKPAVRYQTSEDMKEYVADSLVDPTGQATFESNLKFFNKMIK